MKGLYKILIGLGILVFSSCGVLNFTMATGENDTPGGGTETSQAECNGIKLNTDVPFIGNCIEVKDTTNAFPKFMSALIKIVLSVTLVVCFILIIVAGIMIASNNKLGKGMDLIKKVAITIVLLGLSGVILKLINPTFFG